MCAGSPAIDPDTELETADARKGELGFELSASIGSTHPETRRNSGSANLIENPASCQERVFLRVKRVCFYLYDGVASQGENPVEARRRRERGEREEEICQEIAAGKELVDTASIKAVREAFLPGFKRETPPRDGSAWQQSCQQDVRTKVHVMVAIDPLRCRPIEAAKLVDLSRDGVLKRPDK